MVVGVVGGRYSWNAKLGLVVAASGYEIGGGCGLDGGESGCQGAD